MPPWKSQRVHGQGNGGGTSASAWAVAPPSISASPFRQAKSTISSANAELPIELLSSPSRGLDVSDSSRDLTNGETQGRYRVYISQRLQAHRNKFGPLLKSKEEQLFPVLLPGISSASKWRAAGVEGGLLDSLQDILLLVRRLREGCVAAGRGDAFATDVYALSTFLSLLIGDDIQLSSSLPRLFELASLMSTWVCESVAQDILVVLGSQTPEETLSLLQPGHLASMHLLWLIESGGQVSRIGGVQKVSKGPGGAWWQERDRVMQALHEEKQQLQCQWLKITEDVHSAVSRGDIFRLRSILIKKKLSVWQQALVRRSVERLRGEAWTTLAKAYMHAPFDGLLIDEESVGDDWLERVLLIDLAIMPPPPSSSKLLNSSTPDAWDEDDSIDKVTEDLQGATLQQDAATVHLRATRLAAVLEGNGLPHSASPGATYTGPLHNWMGRKVFQAGQPTLKLR